MSGPTPLAEGYRDSVLWHEAVDPVAAGLCTPTADALPAEVDVAVVGGGYCGLEAATALAERGRSVVVLDRHDLGWGASSRNGGMVIPELKAGPVTLAARHGALGAALHEEVESAFDHVESLVGSGGIDCDYERTGQLFLTHGDRGARALSALADELATVGSPARVVTGEELVAEAGSELFAAGLVVERTGGLHPAKFHAGLAARARDAGAVLFPHTSVHAVGSAQEPAGAGHTVRTARGALRAGAVLLATNAEADGVSPALRRRVLPMESYIIATEPLTPELAATVLPTRRMAFNDRNLLWYWRHGPDGRVLFGGRKRLGQLTVPEARDHLYHSMLEVHPQLAGTRVERAWGGRVALTLDRLPHCGRIDGLWYATGCNGSGVALNTWMGRRMAEAICGDGLPPFAELTHRPVPLHGQRQAWLPVVGTWFRLEDARDR
jgi:glycine/D-amino acid oxidase-like deaminating enzyme